MANPFASYGVPNGNNEIQGLVDQAVILQSALVPKLPEIGITDGMIPIIDQVYPDSGSSSTHTPGTTINFNFGNAHGKLVDWTQSRLTYDVICETSFKLDKDSAASVTNIDFPGGGICLCLRHGAMVFSQVTFGGAGRPITINDFEMVALARSLLTTAESNVTSHIGDVCTHDWFGCASVLPRVELAAGTPKNTVITLEIPIKVSVPLTSVMPMFGSVDNYLLSTTSGIELRLTVSQQNVVCFSGYPAEALTLTKNLFGRVKDLKMENSPCNGAFSATPVDITQGMITGWKTTGTAYAADAGIQLATPKILRLENVKIDLISTQHPDDYILNMLNNICATRGLFYPNQMFIATPFRCKFEASASPTHHAFLVPVVSGYRNIDAVFCWFTKANDPSALRKLPITNVYTSLNGTFKMPVHGYQDHTHEYMRETAQQFNRCFGTINSTLLSPMKDIMECYVPTTYSNYHNDKQQKIISSDSTHVAKTESLTEAMKIELETRDTFIANATMWELEKSSWMNGPDFSQHSNKYQIVFDLEYQAATEEYTFWVVQRFDAYTHVYNGYVNLLTTKEEVAMALAQAQAGQAIQNGA